MMPSEPAIVRPPITTGRQAAITPPKMKNSMTATSGSAMISARLMSSSIPADIAPATGGSLGEFAHLLDSLAAIDLTTLTRRGEADERLAQRVDDARVRGFLLQNLRADGDGFRWQANLDLLRRELPAIGGFPDVGDAVCDRPVLWVAGDRSDYVRPEHGPAMRRLFPRTTLVTIKGAGHWVHSEQPEAFVAVLRTFLGADER